MKHITQFCIFFCIVAMLIAPRFSAAAVTTFDNGKATVELPSTLNISSGHGGSLIAMFGKSSDHKLEISHNAIPDSAGDLDAGSKFIKDQAIKKGLSAKESNGKPFSCSLGASSRKMELPFASYIGKLVKADLFLL